jgi:hypothetical protein
VGDDKRTNPKRLAYEHNLQCFYRFVQLTKIRSGQARYRFGAKIPLLGIVSWSSTAHTSKLTVENDTVNFGYITKAPVEYPNKGVPGRALLDPNHSHFILVSLNDFDYA